MFNNDWDIILKDEIEKEYFINLMNRVYEDYKNKEVLPEKEKIFRALKLTAYKDTKVVILGQDPYPNKTHATGLAFSVDESVKPLPKSLINIYKELKIETGIENTTGDLTKWANEGVLLLNTVLTYCEDDKINIHEKLDWQIFTNKIIELLDNKGDVIFVLWGKKAQAKEKIIKNSKILKSAHPSPLSVYRGFWDNNHFNEINKIYNIDWRI